MKKVLFLMMLLLSGAAVSVEGQVTIGENKPAEKFSVLEIVSNGDKGLRLPQLTTTERNKLSDEIKAITDADKKKLAEGLVIFNKETKCMDFWNGTKWVQMCLGITIAGQLDLSGNYKLSGKTCFDVNQTSSTECGATTSRRDDFASTPPYSFTYQFIHSSSYTGLSFALGGENASIVAEFSYAGETATITFVNDIAARATGKDKEHALKVELIARYLDNAGIFRQISLPISVQDCACGCTVKSTLPAGWLTFMCYNLGADETMTIKQQIDHTPTGDTDATVYGDLYQWGRKADGHEKRTSSRYLTDDAVENDGALDDADLDPVTGQVPDTHAAYGKFIKQISGNYDWRISSCDTLWKDGVKTVNDPCPAGWRVPTQDEWRSIVNGDDTGLNMSGGTATSISGNTWTWNNTNTFGCTVSVNGTTTLFLPAAGGRKVIDGLIGDIDRHGYYWGSTANNTNSYVVVFGREDFDGYYMRAYGFSVRCISE